MQHQKDLDDMMRMAERGIRHRGYEPPAPKELRKLMRLYARSARRWREGICTVRFLLDGTRSLDWCFVLADFVFHRLELPESPES
jgi:hypothetical protein